MHLTYVALHEETWCMVYTERAKMAAVSCGTSHAIAVSTPHRWIFKQTRCKELFSYVESHASAVNLLVSTEQRPAKTTTREL